MGASVALVPDLVEAFTGYRAPSLNPFAGVVDAVATLRRRVPVGIVTDGNPQVQRSKISSLGLANAFDVVVVSDDYGREHRKPHSLPFKLAASLLGAERSRVFMVGDHPDKDVAGAAAAGITPIRVRTGEYSVRPNPVQPWADVADVTVAIELIELIEPTREATPSSRPGGRTAHLHRLG
jgi:putative hydrolase of the HAD superfamily